jgi:hypothetical protein
VERSCEERSAHGPKTDVEWLLQALVQHDFRKALLETAFVTFEVEQNPDLSREPDYN